MTERKRQYNCAKRTFPNLPFIGYTETGRLSFPNLKLMLSLWNSQTAALILHFVLIPLSLRNVMLRPRRCVCCHMDGDSCIFSLSL